MKEVIYVEVYGGLCNRLRALFSGICLAEQLNRSLRIYWPPHQYDCNAKFSDMFEPESLPEWAGIIDHQSECGRVVCFNKNQAMNTIRDKNIIGSHGFFHGEDYHRWQQHLQRLRPTFDLRKKIIKNFNAVPRGLTPIGVHIRRTDNQIAINQSPLSAFKTEMKKIPQGYFYLASDNKDVADSVRKDFPGRVYCNESIRNRYSLQGMQEATVSLYTLAHCPLILCSYWSSFSSVAASIMSARKQVIMRSY